MNETEIIAALDHPDFGLDGKWSSQTKSLMAQFGAQTLELNKWWAFTPQNWKCPSCNRPKRELVKLSGSKCLVAKLVSHHDHANERVEAQAPVVWLPDGSREPTAYALREHLKGLANGFLSRFLPTIVCEGCNNLEPVLKKKFGIPDAITLSPTEIDKLRGYDRTLRDQNLEDLISQLLEWADFSKSLIDLAKKSFRPDIHPVYVGYGGWLNTEDLVERSAVSRARDIVTNQTLQGNEAVEEFLGLSLAKQSNPNTKRKKLVSPTEADYANFKHPNPGRQSVIDKMPQDWICSICRRSAFECFASSPKTPKKYMLNVFERTVVFDFGQLEETVIICGDCNDFHNGLARYCKEEKIEEFAWLIEERKIDADAVRQGIKSAPHQRHEFDFEAAFAFLAGSFVEESVIDFEADF
jgi:rubredoxin